ILDVSKIESGKFELDESPIDLFRHLNEFYSLINVKAKEKGIELRFRSIGEIPKTVVTDPIRLNQILFNLVGNGIKFTDRGYVELTVRAEKMDNLDQVRLIFRVTDTGVGIPRKYLRELFTPFSQADMAAG